MVSPRIHDSVVWYRRAQRPIPAHFRVYKPVHLDLFDPSKYEPYDPEEHRTAYYGMIGEKEYFLPSRRDGFVPVPYRVKEGSVPIIWHAEPGYRAKQMVISNVDRFKRQLARCHGKKPRARFQAFPLILVLGGGDMDHMNMIVIDTVQKTLTRFEPHGAVVEFYSPKDVDREVRRVLVPVIESALGISGVRVISSWDFCPMRGLQVAEVRQTRYPKQTKVVDGKTVNAEKGGYCDAWSAMWLHYRILNPNKSDKQVYDMIHAGWDDLATKIRAYVTAIVTSFMDKLAKEKEDTLRGG